METRAVSIILDSDAVLRALYGRPLGSLVLVAHLPPGAKVEFCGLNDDLHYELRYTTDQAAAGPGFVEVPIP